MTSAAVFDLDNTLIRGSALFHFGMTMVRRRIVKPRHVLRFAFSEFALASHSRERAGLPTKVAERTLGIVEGLPQERVRAMADDFVRSRLDRYLVPEAVAQLRRCQELGYPTYLATASPQELADAVADRLGMTAALGTVAQVVDGLYTGRLLGPINYGPAKAHRVQQVLSRDGVDPGSSWAFSDSVSDVPMLALVGNPVVVNADAELERIALAGGWRLLRTRPAPVELDPTTPYLYSPYFP